MEGGGEQEEEQEEEEEEEGGRTYQPSSTRCYIVDIHLAFSSALHTHPEEEEEEEEEEDGGHPYVGPGIDTFPGVAKQNSIF